MGNRASAVAAVEVPSTKQSEIQSANSYMHFAERTLDFMCIQQSCRHTMTDSMLEETAYAGDVWKDEVGEGIATPRVVAQIMPELDRCELGECSIDLLVADWRSRLKTYTCIPMGGHRSGFIARLSFDAELQCLDVQEERHLASTAAAAPAGGVANAPVAGTAELYPMSALGECIATPSSGDVFELRVCFFHEDVDALDLLFESFEDRLGFARTLDVLAGEAREHEKWHSSDCTSTLDADYDDDESEDCFRAYI